MILDIQPISQLDDRWQNERLGTSYTTIGQYGCLLTCVAMLLKFYGHDTDPKRLNTWLKEHAGYQSGNLFVWGSLPVLDKRLSVNYSGNIDAQLEKGIPSIVKVDMIPSTSVVDEHWVLVVGKQGNEYIINDPKDGAQVVFNDRYGDPATKIYNVASYDAAVPDPDPELPGEDEYISALMCLPEILDELKRSNELAERRNVLLESNYKLLEAVLWRKQ